MQISLLWGITVTLSERPIDWRTVMSRLSHSIAEAKISLDAAIFAGGALLWRRYDELLAATERGVRFRFLLAHPELDWVRDLIEPSGLDPLEYSKRIHVAASRALMLGDAAEVRWQPFPIPWWLMLTDRERVYMKAINIAGRPPGAELTTATALIYFNNLFDSAWEKADPAGLENRSGENVENPNGAESSQVFLCHATEDKLAIRKLYQRLLQDRATPWLDEQNLIPGQDWELEISRAIRRSSVVLICLSNYAIKKRGFVQREVRLAMRVADEMPMGSIFVIPVRLEPCEVPDFLKHLHWVDLFEPRGYPLLLRALRAVSG